VGRDFRPLVLMQLGFTMVGSIVLSLVLGLWFDSHFGTSPWGLLAAMVLGVLAGTIGVARLVSQAIDESTRDRRR
jgi:F0F1-type ATP synthase assembly protein I